jgi:predicted extracellular nuclease
VVAFRAADYTDGKAAYLPFFCRSHSMRYALAGSLIVLSLCSYVISVAAADELTIASWNVENLFDLDDDPSVELDEEYTPASPKQWTQEKLDIKLNNLASVIGKLNGGRGPDVLGLCEVENRKVVEMLASKLASLGRDYQVIHQESPSDRGIDTAIIYDAKVFDLADHKFHFVDAEKTRDIVEVQLRRKSAGDDAPSLYVFENHWPSRGNDEWQRIMAASVLRKRLDAILASDPQADILMMGDFNDEPHNVAIEKFLRARRSQDGLGEGDLFNTAAQIAAADKGSFVYDNRWELIDHIIVSQGLLNEDGYRWKPGSTQTVEFSEIFFHPRWKDAIPRPSKSYAGNTFHKDGYSDHLAVFCVLED